MDRNGEVVHRVRILRGKCLWFSGPVPMAVVKFVAAFSSKSHEV